MDLESLYRSAFPKAVTMVRRYGGDMADAKDLFHDALLAFLEKPPRNIRVSEEVYVLGICRHLMYRRRPKTGPLDTDLPEEPTPTEVSVWNYLQHAGRRCLDLLKAFYIDQRDMTSIADTFGYSSAHSATVQKYKCLEKVREQIREHEEVLD
jgi:DNA-directed RNA polymerase specialized sigma24 family protein